MRNELVLIRHSDEPADDRVFTYARMNGLVPIEKFPFRGDRLGEPTENTLGTVVYGGMFNVFEEEKHPFLHEENRWIRACMDANLPVLGLCQGAQQIARVFWGRRLDQHPITAMNSDIMRSRQQLMRDHS